MRHSNLIRIFEFRSHGEAFGKSRDRDIFPSEEFLKIEAGGFAFDIGIEGEDDFGGLLVFEAGEKLGHLQVFWGDAFEGIDVPPEDIIEASVESRIFHGDEILGFGDNAKRLPVAVSVRANGTGVAEIDIAAYGTVLVLFDESCQGL
ncbi:MAG: hypothetical protein G01um101418_394 [Parcubacteria group bacterium Gr01-1014_18]|nr:MAG: hypothetical protein Greene041636_360 [Parcubacteria group bacterium Greene0416_36]TSC81115.1 MAG: hypothetical protein G01um101418_394 [Parcubacteria group bacterium Gr01-1014_18]TSC98469.1 MAG: hypothetical protein Greene101420_706 [Parcubacteria group bacterium Greene1014_20]TSD07366.1 MAG: hypothetical protein Greene07142_221 [Parcubacteria group bacterium Greene0714_2]